MFGVSRRFVAGGCLLLACLAAGSAQASLAVGDARGSACATVSVPVTLALPTNAMAAQFDLAFSAASFRGVGFTNSPGFARQRVDAWPTATGRHRVLVWSADGKPLPRQAVVNVTLAIGTNAPLGDHEIAVSEWLLSDPQGRSLETGGTTGGRVTVTSPASDRVPPTVTLIEPARNSVTVSSDGRIAARGMVADNAGVCEVMWQLNGEPARAVMATSDWGASVPARAGSNWIEVTAIDGAGLRSSTVGRAFYWRPAHPVTLNQIGAGKITGATNGQILEIDRRYTLAAIAEKGWLFAGWSGDALATGTTLSFAMRSNFAVRATFVPNRFPGLAGTWSGLVRETPPQVESSGLMTLSLTPAGTFSGKLLMRGVALSISGRFGADGRYEGLVSRPAATGLMQVILEMPLGDPLAPLRGYVLAELWTAELEAYRIPAVPTGTPLARWAGSYTAVIPHAEEGPTRAEGDGVLTLTVGKSGMITAAGTLGDATPVSFAAKLTTAGSWPFYASLYGSGGVLLGLGTFDSQPGTDLVSDEVHWIKPAGSSPVDSAGFTNVLVLDGSRYDKNQRAVAWTNGTAWLVGGGVPAPLPHALQFDADKFAVSNNTIGLNLKLAASGAFSGAFTNPATRMKTSLRGVIHQKRGEGAGNFSGTNVSGRIFLQPR